jgi:predicted ester cyclase
LVFSELPLYGVLGSSTLQRGHFNHFVLAPPAKGSVLIQTASEAKGDLSMSEENKDLARRSWEAVDNPDLIDEVYAADVVWHEPDREIHGTQEAKQLISLYKTAFPDMSVTVEDQIAEGDKVVTRVTIRGTHQGETEEFGPPTGRQIEGDLVTISRIEGGKIVEDWDSYDNLTLLQQLGLAPEQ